MFGSPCASDPHRTVWNRWPSGHGKFPSTVVQASSHSVSGKVCPEARNAASLRFLVATQVLIDKGMTCWRSLPVQFSTTAESCRRLRFVLSSTSFDKLLEQIGKLFRTGWAVLGVAQDIGDQGIELRSMQKPNMLKPGLHSQEPAEILDRRRRR